MIFILFKFISSILLNLDSDLAFFPKTLSIKTSQCIFWSRLIFFLLISSLFKKITYHIRGGPGPHGNGALIFHMVFMTFKSPPSRTSL